MKNLSFSFIVNQSSSFICTTVKNDAKKEIKFLRYEMRKKRVFFSWCFLRGVVAGDKSTRHSGNCCGVEKCACVMKMTFKNVISLYFAEFCRSLAELLLCVYRIFLLILLFIFLPLPLSKNVWKSMKMLMIKFDEFFLFSFMCVWKLLCNSCVGFYTRGSINEGKIIKLFVLEIITASGLFYWFF